MSDVLCKYRPVPFIPIYRKKWICFPERLEDLSGKQFLALSDYIHEKGSHVPFLSAVSGIPKKQCRMLDEYQVYSLLNLTDSIFEPEGTTKHFFHKIKVKRQTLHGYLDGFKYVKFGEFIFADTYYQAYRAGKQSMLEKFIAVLFRPSLPESKGDLRIPFNEEDVDDRQAVINKIPARVKKAIALNYALIRRDLEKKYPFVFPESNDQFSGSGSWVDVYDSVVGDDMIHSKEYADLYLTTVMRKINKAIKEEMKRK